MLLHESKDDRIFKQPAIQTLVDSQYQRTASQMKRSLWIYLVFFVLPMMQADSASHSFLTKTPEAIYADNPNY
jgi:hypothetical protein